MRILQIGNTDLVGKRFNGHYLNRYFIQLGLNSCHLVWKKDSGDTKTFELISLPGARIINAIFNRIEKYLSVQSVLSPFSFKLIFDKRFRSADIVHYHLIHTGFFNLLALPILTRLRPSVWTLHDPWAMTGHCVYPPNGCIRWKSGCGSCPDLNVPIKISRDNTAFMWKLKKFIYSKSKIHLIVASKWMLSMVNNSPLMKNCPVKHIPLGIDLSVFSKSDLIESKRRLGIASDRLVISFRAVNSEFKGLSYIKDALDNLKTDKKICLLTFDQVGLVDDLSNKFQVVDLGWLHSEIELADAYNAADIFLMPSVSEAFGMMAIEAMACGKPIIVFDNTSLAEVTFAPLGAIAVSQGDGDSFKRALEFLIENPLEREQLGNRAEKIATENYSFEAHARRVLDLYSDILI